MKKLFLFFIFALVLLFPWRSFASVMTVAPSPANPDLVVVRLDTQGDSINAVEGHFTFNPNDFSISNVTDGGSIINFWVASPSFSNTSGTLDFAGVIPGGEVISNGIIATIDIVPTGSATTSSFMLVSAQALLNDGSAMPSNLSVVSKAFPLVAGSAALIGKNTLAPNPFTPEIGQDPSIFDGHYFVVFFATDQASGIDHYEVLEVPAGAKVATSSLGWHVAPSPYLLTDQTLSSDIYVRAFDTSGNFRTEKISAEHKKFAASFPWGDIAVSVAAIVLLLMVVMGMRKRRTWKRKRSVQNFG